LCGETDCEAYISSFNVEVGCCVADARSLCFARCDMIRVHVQIARFSRNPRPTTYAKVGGVALPSPRAEEFLPPRFRLGEGEDRSVAERSDLSENDSGHNEQTARSRYWGKAQTSPDNRMERIPLDYNHLDDSAKDVRASNGTELQQTATSTRTLSALRRHAFKVLPRPGMPIPAT